MDEITEVAAVLQEELGDFTVSFARGVCESRAAPAVLEVDVHAVLDQLLHHAQVAHAARQVQARALVVVGRVRVAAAVEQHLDSLDVPRASKLAQLAARLTLVPHERRPLPAQVHHHFGVSLTHAVNQCSATPAVLEVDICLGLHQRLHDVQVSRARGQVHARSLVVVCRVGLAATLEQQLDLVVCIGKGSGLGLHRAKARAKGLVWVGAGVQIGQRAAA